MVYCHIGVALSTMVYLRLLHRFVAHSVATRGYCSGVGFRSE